MKQGTPPTAYNIRQLELKSKSKEWIFILIMSVIIMLLNPSLAYIFYLLKVGFWLKVFLFAALNGGLLGFGIAVFLKRNTSFKRVELTKEYLLLTTIDPQKCERQDKITPDMIRCYRYIDGSETASRFEVLTYDAALKLYIPDTILTKKEEYNAFVRALMHWFETHQIVDCAIAEK